MSTILFDMDGTLLDTEKLYQKAWLLGAKDCGYDLKVEGALTLRSLGKPYNVIQFQKLLGQDADINKVRVVRNQYMEQFFAEGIPLKPKVRETLEALRQRGHRTAIVTATPANRTHRLLKETGLDQYFDQIVCVAMVGRGKPAPDVYLYACEQMGTLPSETYAVEDSPNGVKSAADAGCRVIMIPDLTQPDLDTEQLLFHKADQLMDLLDIIK